jgi:hypothetical protein
MNVKNQKINNEKCKMHKAEVFLHIVLITVYFILLIMSFYPELFCESFTFEDYMRPLIPHSCFAFGDWRYDFEYSLLPSKPFVQFFCLIVLVYAIFLYKRASDKLRTAATIMMWSLLIFIHPVEALLEALLSSLGSLIFSVLIFLSGILRHIWITFGGTIHY